MKTIILRCALAFWCAILFINVSFGQRTITGVVINKQSLEPLSKATILSEDLLSEVYTDSIGQFEIIIASNNKNIFIAKRNYSTQSIDISDVAKDYFSIQLVESDLKNNGIAVIEEKASLFAKTLISNSSFNQSNITHAYQLVQNRAPGLTITRPGGNPNEDFAVRIRGLNSLSQNTTPLIVVDDIPVHDINQIDPENIASIEVLRDVASTARYGIRGGSGVIKIKTKTADSYAPLQVKLHSFITTEKVTRRLPFADKRAFLLAGGEDFGSETDWIDEITDNAFSHNHHLSFDGHFLNTNTVYRVGLTYRDVAGTLRKTGFDRTGARLHLYQALFKNAVTVRVNAAANQTNRQLGFPLAFRYAHTFNPTAPVRSDDDFSQQYGGYFQRPVFDYYNPVAIIEQGNNDATDRYLTANAQLSYQFLNDFNLNLIGSQTSERNHVYTSFPTNSFFTQYGDGSNFQQNLTENIDNQYFKGNLGYALSNSNGINAFINLGYDAQRIETQRQILIGQSFAENELNFTDLNTAQAFRTEQATVFDALLSTGNIANEYHEVHQLAAFFGNVEMDYRDIFSLSASLRREGSSRLGSNEKWGWFPALSGLFDVDKLLKIRPLSVFNLRGSYGVTGGLPTQGGLSVAPIGRQENHFYNGEFRSVLNTTRNPNTTLTYEQTRGLNLGLDLRSDGSLLGLKVDWYQQRSSGLIAFLFVSSPPNLNNFTYLNAGVLRNQGVEIALDMQLIKKENLHWNTQLIYQTNNTFLEEFANGDVSQFPRFGLASVRKQYLRFGINEPFGQIIAHEFTGFTPDGQAILTDQNQDGIVDSDDMIRVGNTYPTNEIGWFNTINWGNLELNFLLRGAFGHSLLNTNRILYETGNSSTYNIILTEFAPPSVGFYQPFNSYHVEKASFIRLDNILLNYRINPKKGRIKYQLYLGARNLFTITNYTGNDPELRLEHDYLGNFDVRNVNNHPNILASGIDERNTYYLGRSWVIGVRLQW